MPTVLTSFSMSTVVAITTAAAARSVGYLSYFLPQRFGHGLRLLAARICRRRLCGRKQKSPGRAFLPGLQITSAVGYLLTIMARKRRIVY